MNFKSDKNATQVILYGGLGNQLFQYGVALSYAIARSTGVKVSLIGEANSYHGNLPDIFDFELPLLVENNLLPIRKSKLIKVGIRALLMVSNSESGSLFVRRITRAIGYFLSLFFGLGSRKFFASPSGLGFDPKFKIKSDRHLLLGNFHSYRWISTAAKALLLQGLKLKSKNHMIDEYESLALQENPIAVHIRLGDYLDIEELNVINKDYFTRALNYLASPNIIKVIWIFTNDKSKLQTYLPEDERFKVRVISNLLSPSETLEVMRMCDNHVISNSTFSWWGAFLGRNPYGTVIAPKRWFKNRKDPFEICPPEWVRL